MSEFTREQIKVLRSFAQKYDKALFDRLSQRQWATIRIHSAEEAAAFEAFANNICRWVLRDYPDYAGKQADINADAEMVTFMIADILADYHAAQHNITAP